MKFPPEFTCLLARAMERLEPFKPQTKPNRFVTRIDSFTWLQAVAIPPKISSLWNRFIFLTNTKNNKTTKIDSPKLDLGESIFYHYSTKEFYFKKVTFLELSKKLATNTHTIITFNRIL